MGCGASKAGPSAAATGRRVMVAVNNGSLRIADTHAVLGNSLVDFPADHKIVTIGMGCFWGAERKFWKQDGVFSTQVGYAGGTVVNPSYEQVCGKRTGHSEVVRVVYDPAKTTLEKLLKVFWESHDPTQGDRQGNDVGSQYRSVVYVDAGAELDAVNASAAAYQAQLTKAGRGQISTEILATPTFYYAEDYHQQYLAPGKNPGGYCGLRGTGVACPI